MPNQQKYRPISFRPPEDDRLWLLAYKEQTGQPMNAILAVAVQRLRISVTDYDRGLIAKARQLADLPAEAVREFTAEPDSRDAFVAAFTLAQIRLGELLDLIDRQERPATTDQEARP